MKKKLLVAACALLAFGALGVGSNEAAAQCGYGGGYGGGFRGGYGYSAPRRSSFSIGIGYSSGYRGSSYYGVGGYHGGYGRSRGHYHFHRGRHF